MDLNAALIAFVTTTFDPAAGDEALQYVADGRPLHAEPGRQLRSWKPRVFAYTRERAMDRDRRVGHTLELTIQSPHAIHECARREQGVPLKRAST